MTAAQRQRLAADILKQIPKKFNLDIKTNVGLCESVIDPQFRQEAAKFTLSIEKTGLPSTNFMSFFGNKRLDALLWELKFNPDEMVINT